MPLRPPAHGTLGLQGGVEGTPRLFWGAPRLGGPGSFPRGAGAPLRFGAAALRRFKPPFFPCPSRGRGRLGQKGCPPMRVPVFWGPAAGGLFLVPGGLTPEGPVATATPPGPVAILEGFAHQDPHPFFINLHKILTPHLFVG